MEGVSDISKQTSCLTTLEDSSVEENHGFTQLSTYSENTNTDQPNEILNVPKPTTSPSSTQPLTTDLNSATPPSIPNSTPNPPIFPVNATTIHPIPVVGNTPVNLPTPSIILPPPLSLPNFETSNGQDAIVNESGEEVSDKMLIREIYKMQKQILKRLNRIERQLEERNVEESRQPPIPFPSPVPILGRRTQKVEAIDLTDGEDHQKKKQCITPTSIPGESRPSPVSVPALISTPPLPPPPPLNTPSPTNLPQPLSQSVISPIPPAQTIDTTAAQIELHVTTDQPNLFTNPPKSSILDYHYMLDITVPRNEQDDAYTTLLANIKTSVAKYCNSMIKWIDLNIFLLDPQTGNTMSLEDREYKMNNTLYIVVKRKVLNRNPFNVKVLRVSKSDSVFIPVDATDYVWEMKQSSTSFSTNLNYFPSELTRVFIY